MITISLASYTFKVRLKNSREHLNLNTINNQAFTYHIERFLDNIKNVWHDENARQQIIQVVNDTQVDRIIEENKRGTIFAGTIRFGEYGIAANLINRDTPTRQFDRQELDVEFLNMHYLIYIPVNHHVGVIILQRFKEHGIKELFEKAFRNYLSMADPSLVMQLFDAVPEVLIKHLNNSDCTVSKIRFLATHLKRDVTSHNLGDGNVEEEYNYELSLVAKKKSPTWWKKILHLNNQRKWSTNSDFVQLLPMVPEKTKITLNINNKEKVYEVGRPDNTKPYTDITDRINIAGGVPNQEDIAREAKDLLEDILLGIEGA